MYTSEQTSAIVDWDTPPAGVETIIEELRQMRVADGHTPYARVAERIALWRAGRGVPEHERAIARSTVYDQFRIDRKRLDHDLAIEIAVALGLPEQQIPRWAQRCRDAQAATSATSVVTLHDPPPPVARDFVGRTREIERVLRQIGDGGGVWISGPPGMGKTQLALAAAERIRAEGIADRTVVIDLRGFRHDARPTDAAAAQDALLRHLGVPRSAGLEKAPAARIRALRQALLRSRAVLVLDDAPDDDHVTRIVGAGALSGVIVTSRRRPPDADARMLSFALDRLSDAEAVALLRSSAGTAVLDEDPDAAARLVAVVGGLPLALDLAAARIREHSEWTLADHLSLVERRLGQARVDAPLESALQLSFDGIEEQDAFLARSFASSPIGALDAGIAASILGIREDAAAQALERLAAHSLLIPDGGGRWQMHELPRAFARELSFENDPASLRKSVHARIDHHLVTQSWSAYAALAERAGVTVRPARFAFEPVPMSADVADHWVSSRLDILLDAALAGPAAGRGDTLIRISEGLSWWLNLSGRYRQALQLHEAALNWAVETEDVTANAAASLDLGQLLLELRRPEEALVPLRRASRLEGEFDDPGIRGVLLNMLGVGQRSLGQKEAAIDHFERAIAIHEELDQTNRLLSCLINLGVTLHDLGRFEEELGVMDRAVPLAEGASHRQMHAHLLANRAETLIALGDYRRALPDSQQAATIAEEVGFVVGLVVAENNSGEILLRSGDPDRAMVHFERALRTAEEIGRADMSAEVAVGIVRALIARNDEELPAAIDRARELCRTAADPRLSEMLEVALREDDAVSVAHG